MNKPLGPYSPFVRAGDFIIVSGQGGMRDGAVVEGGVTAQTEQTMRNIADRLAEAGAAAHRRRQDAVLPHRHGHVRRVQRRLRRGVRRPPPGALDGRGLGAARRDERRGRGLGLQAGLTTSPPTRCAWADAPPNTAYHDEEWGVPKRDARTLFEFLVLEGAQAGLSWTTILNKRDGYRAAFAGFDPVAVAAFDEADVARCLADPGIVRNRAKVASVVDNARAWLELDDPAAHLWSFVDGHPVQNRFRAMTRRPRLRRAGGSDEQGPQAPRVPLRRADDLLRPDAGVRAGQRPRRELLPPRRVRRPRLSVHPPFCVSMGDHRGRAR